MSVLQDAGMALNIRSKILNEPGSWSVFISHSRRSATAPALAEKLASSFRKRGYLVWLDVDMRDKSEAAMLEGVRGSNFLVAIITDDGPEGSAYFSREFCVKELRCAVENDVFVQPVVSVYDKVRIGELLNKAADDLRGMLLKIDFKDLNRDDIGYWNLGMDKIIEAAIANNTGLPV
jgi:hypothetical protein